MNTPIAMADPLAELALVGSMLHGASIADEVLATVPRDAIRDTELGTIYQAVQTLREHQVTIDLIAVHRETRIGGNPVSLEALTRIAKSGMGSAANVSYHARHVINCYQLQHLIEAAEMARRRAWDMCDAETIIGELSASLMQIASHTQHHAQLIELGESVGQVWESLQAGAQPGISTGFRDLDALTGGWHAGDLNLLAARPGIGKTALSLNFAIKVAEQGVPVFFSSLEMSHLQLSQRVLSSGSRIDSQRIRLRNVPEHEMQYIYEAMQQLVNLPVTIYDKAAITNTDLRNRVSVWRNRNHTKPAMLFVDYLQLMRSVKRGENRVQEIGELSGSLKAIARDFDMPVVAMSQLSRAIEGRTGHIPMLSDLRESGSLEQDADMVIFIHRDEVYDQDTDKKGLAELHIAKHRGGPVGIVPMRFDIATNAFSDLTYRHLEGY